MSKIDKNGNIDITSANPHLKEGAKNGTFRESSSSSKHSTVSGIGIFKIFLLILVIISFSYYIRNGAYIDFSFKSLLERLAQTPDVSVSFTSVDLTIYGDWGFFDFFRGYLNQFTSIMEISLILIGYISQMFVVLWHLLGLFFI